MYLQLSFQVSTVWGRSGHFRDVAYLEVVSHLMVDVSCECFVLGFLQWTPYAICSSSHDVPTAELQLKEHCSSLHQHGGGIYCSLGNLAVSIPQEKMTALLWNPVTSTLREWCGLMNPSIIHNRICRVQDASRVVLHWRAQSCALPWQVTAATVTSWLQWLRHDQKTELPDFLSLNQLKNNVCHNKKESAH